MLVKRRHSRPIPQGAELIEREGRRCARWTTASGRTKIAPLNRKGNRIVIESRCWFVRLRDRDTRRWQEWRAYTDRQASAALEIEILRRIERGEVGLADPLAFHRKRPVAEHLADFEAHLAGKGNTVDHVEKTLARCRRILARIEARTVADLTAEAVETALDGLRREGMSLSTANGYFRAIRALGRWLLRTRRVRENPLAGLSCRKVADADRKRRRRCLLPAEIAALIQAARRSPEPFMGLAGLDRAMLYAVAVSTGLRASELASLTPESFELETSGPLVRCLGGYTKNGQEAVLPLRSDLVAGLRVWLTGKPPRAPVWPGPWARQRHGAEMLRNDLTTADIEYEDAAGRVADFHALRHTFISNLARAGVHPRHAQALARHSSIELTMNVYTHLELADLAGQLEAMPSVLEPNQPPPTAPAEEEGELTSDLAGLTRCWSELPEHIRQAIATLARG